MRYGLVFLTLAVLLGAMAGLYGGWYWLALWPAVSFLLVAAAYLGAGAAVLGKRPDGTLSPSRTIVLAPYHLLSWSAWHVLRLLERREAWNEIAPGLRIGRRVLARELPEDISLVVDLTAEFAEPRAIRRGREYLCLPILDASVVSDEEFAEAVEQAAERRDVVYVHCAQGQGRSATFGAAVLLARGVTDGPDEAVRIVRSIRPGIDLKPAQRALLDRFARQCNPIATDPGGGRDEER